MDAKCGRGRLALGALLTLGITLWPASLASQEAADVAPEAGSGVSSEVTEALEDLTSWVGGNAVPLLAGLLVYLALLFAIRRATSGGLRRADELYEQIETLAGRLEEIQGPEKTPEEQAALARERERQEERNQALTKEAKGLRRRAETVRGTAAWVLGVALVVFIVMLFVTRGGFESLGGLRSPEALGAIGGWLMQRVVKIAVIVIALLIAMRLVRVITGRLERVVSDRDDTTLTEAEMRAHTLANVINSTAAVILTIVGIVMILEVFGLPIAPVLAGVGIVGLAVGFGAQSLVKDFISGFFLLVENHYRVGDVVKIAGIGGLVERITLRATYLRDLSGSVHVIPNGEISTVMNMTFQWSRHVAEIGTSYDADPDRVIEILHRVGADMRQEEPWSEKITEDPEVLGLDGFGDSALVFKVLLKTRPLQQWAVGREYNRRVFYALGEAGIEIPFPHRTTYLRMENGEALRLLLDQSDQSPGALDARPTSTRTHIPQPVAEEASGGDLSEEQLGPPPEADH
jgi:small conductance mechanosensitive channel